MVFPFVVTLLTPANSVILLRVPKVMLELKVKSPSILLLDALENVPLNPVKSRFLTQA